MELGLGVGLGLGGWVLLACFALGGHGMERCGVLAGSGGELAVRKFGISDWS